MRRTPNRYELDMEKFAQGFRLWLENGGDRYGAVSNGEVDTCEIDGGNGRPHHPVRPVLAK